MPRSRGGQTAQPPQRRRSPQAVSALDAFTSLYAFFGRDVLVAEALGWDEATVAAWRERQVVRPQRAKSDEVELLLELCEETRPYLREDGQVGAWVTTPLPNLRGATPAAWLRLRGRRGLRELVHGLVDWMPRLPVGEIEPVDERAAAAALSKQAADPAVVEFQRMLDRSS
jgi:hypothetical protein